METNDKKRKNTNYIHQQEFKDDQEFINKLKNKIISNDSIIIALIGQNGSKKATILEKLYEIVSKDERGINLAIMKLKKHEDEYFECIKNYIGNNLKNFIKSLISNLTNEKKIIQCEEFLSKFKLECEKQKDEYFLEEDFDLFIKSNDENYINLNDKTIRRIIKNNQSTYIFLCLLVAFVEACLNLKENYEFVKNIMILEYPTTYCHPSLTKRIAYKMNDLQMKNFCSFVFSTHSSQLLFEIANSLRLSYTKDDFNNKFLIAQGLKINEKLKYRLIENDFTQEGINSRNLGIIINCCFSENVILVEGLKDYELANQIIKNNNQLNDYLCDVYDCNSKGEVIKVYTYLWQHKIIEPFAFVDMDEDSSESLEEKFKINNKESFFYAFDTTLEVETKDSNPSSKNNLKWYTFQNIQKMPTYKNIINAVYEYFNRIRPDKNN